MPRTITVLALVGVAALLACSPSSRRCSSSDARCASPQDVFSTPRPLADAPLPPPGPPQLQVEYAGCATVMVAPTGEVQCIYEPGRELRLWVVHHAAAEPSLTVTGAGRWRLAGRYLREEEPGQGQRLLLESEGLHEVVVAAPGAPTWRLAVRAMGELTAPERSARERFLALSLELEGAIVRTEDPAIVLAADALIQHAATEGLLSDAVYFGLAASYHIDGSMQRPDLAQWLLERIQPLADRFPEGAGGLSIYLGHVLRRRGRLVDAAATYRRGGRHAVRMDQLGHQLDVLAPYAQTLAELGYFEAAAYWAAAARGLAEQELRPHDLAALLTVVAETGLHLAQERRIHDDPEPHLAAIVQMYGPSGVFAGLREPAVVRLSLAELALLRNDPAGVRPHLELLEHAPLTIDEEAKVLDLRLQAQQMSGAVVDARELRATLLGLEGFAARALGPDVRWRAMVLRGMVHEQLGERVQARAAYEGAEDLLDELVPLAALGVPGELTAARRGEGTSRLVELLVADGELEAAVCAVRRSRSRVSRRALVLRRLDEGAREGLRARIERYQDERLAYEELRHTAAGNLADPQHDQARSAARQRRRELEHHALEILSSRAGYDPTTSCDELSARRPGELLLVLFPRGDGLSVLVSDDDGTTHHPLEGYADVADSLDPLWLSTYLLGPIHERLARAERVRVIASGRATAIAVHALHWAREPAGQRMPLAMQVPVVYGHDLPVGPDEPEPGVSRTALLLADRSAEGTKLELERVAERLAHAQWWVRTLATKDLTIGEVHELLARADHLHYAGHAYYADAATDLPRRGWQDDDDRQHLWPPYSGGAASVPAYIPLGSLGRLTVPDILMMEHVPRTVVLMGCATGVVDERTALGGFSLATAFLAAGSRAVVASTGEIDGGEAALLGSALYSGLTADSVAEPGRWMSDALRVAVEQGLPERAVATYRVLVP